MNFWYLRKPMICSGDRHVVSTRCARISDCEKSGAGHPRTGAATATAALGVFSLRLVVAGEVGEGGEVRTSSIVPSVNFTAEITVRPGFRSFASAFDTFAIGACSSVVPLRKIFS